MNCDAAATTTSTKSTNQDLLCVWVVLSKACCKPSPRRKEWIDYVPGASSSAFFRIWYDCVAMTPSFCHDQQFCIDDYTGQHITHHTWSHSPFFWKKQKEVVITLLPHAKKGFATNVRNQHSQPTFATNIPMRWGALSLLRRLWCMMCDLRMFVTSHDSDGGGMSCSVGYPVPYVTPRI